MRFCGDGASGASSSSSESRVMKFRFFLRTIAGGFCVLCSQTKLGEVFVRWRIDFNQIIVVIVFRSYEYKKLRNVGGK